MCDDERNERNISYFFFLTNINENFNQFSRETKFILDDLKNIN